MFKAWLEERKKSIVQELSDLLAIPSVSEASDNPAEPYGKACRQAADYMSDLARKYGLHAEKVDNRYLIVRGERAEDRPQIGIFCHLDVVPAGEGWSFPPYALSEKEGYLIGRGVGDNKGASIIALHLLSYLQESQLKNFGVFIFYGLNEEAGMSDIKAYLASHPAPDLALVPDVELPVCIGEKSRLVFTLTGKLQLHKQISLQGGVADNVIPQKGFAKIEGHDLVAEATGGHAAFPKDGANALTALLAQILQSGLLDSHDQGELAKLEKLIAPYHGEGLDLAYTDARGDVLTLVCTQLKLTEDGDFLLGYDCRFPAELPADRLIEKLTEACHKQGLELEISKNDPSLDKDLDEKLVEALVAICNRYTGRQDPAYRMGGGTYARHFSQGLGLGIGQKFTKPNFIKEGQGGAHQADECIPQNQLWDGLHILYESLCWIDTHYDLD
ncbi:MAG: M20/M25/M40 family metallo-hydrolase [Eubacteriales bacterium]|nr:M20/M25/M40 family metallo-hydrolase [Eubacteriales bacterium]